MCKINNTLFWQVIVSEGSWWGEGSDGVNYGKYWYNIFFLKFWKWSLLTPMDKLSIAIVIILILLQTLSQHGMFERGEDILEMPTQTEGSTTDFIFDEDLPPLTYTLTDSTSESRGTKKGKFTITEGSLAEKHETLFSQGKSEIDSKFEVNKAEERGTVGSLQLSQAKLSSCEDAFLSPKLKMLHSPDSRSTSSPDSSSPVLTLASSFKDSSSVSRGFIVPEPPKQP